MTRVEVLIEELSREMIQAKDRKPSFLAVQLNKEIIREKLAGAEKVGGLIVRFPSTRRKKEIA
jgi:hypothetical protein